MQTSRDDDYAPPPPVPLAVDVLDADLADTKSETPPSNEILQTYNKPSFTMQTLLSAVDCLPTIGDSNADGTESSSRTISHDILHEILSRMPAKSAIKFSSSLCKWSIIHSDPRFIKKQCILSCGQENAFFLQQKKRKTNKAPNKLEFHLLPWETNSAFGIPSESLNFLPKSGRILSSSNGLLLLCNPSLTGAHEFKLCNPAIREWAPLPIPGGGRVLFDEAFLPLIECYPPGQQTAEFPNDYTIALPVSYSMCWQMINGTMGRVHKQDLLIYSNGRWEEELCEVGAVDHLVRFDMPVPIFSNKGLVVHYLCDSDPPKYRRFLEPYIAAFSLEEEKLARNIKLPEGAWDREVAEKHGGSQKKLMIFKWNETSICLVRWWFGHGEIKAWVLDDCGCENEAWRVIMDSSESELLPDENSVVSVGVAGGGRGLLIATAPVDDVSDGFSRVFVYVVEGENRGSLELVGEHRFGFKRDSSGDCETLRFLPYANTLRPVSVLNSQTRTY